MDIDKDEPAWVAVSPIEKAVTQATDLLMVAAFFGPVSQPEALREVLIEVLEILKPFRAVEL